MIGFDRLHYSLAYLITAIGLIPVVAFWRPVFIQKHVADADHTRL